MPKKGKSKSTSDEPPNGEYKVGPGNPPIHSQFKKGQSGNPGGKKKGTLNYRTVLNDVLAREVPTTGGTTMPVLQALYEILASEALKERNLKAAIDLLDRAERFLPAEAEDEHEISEADDEIIRRGLKRMRVHGEEAHSPAEEDEGE